MSFAHNIMIRNLNSLILQFPNVSKPEDIADFIVFCQIVHETIRGHHHLEEKYLFPDIEAYSGQKGIMEKNISQHHAFEEGLKKFSEYIHSVTPETWDRETFRGILDSFIPALSQHLREEIPTLLALNKYGPEKLKKAWDDLEQRIVKGSIDPVCLIPLNPFD
jgi:hemerythrin-like domain-containing protein